MKYVNMWARLETLTNLETLMLNPKIELLFMTSAAEAEIGALFVNSKLAIQFRTTLMEMGHPQPPTPIKTDNATALGYIHNNIKQKRSKSFDMKISLATR